MPAVAIPAAVALVGTAVSAIGAHKQRKAAEKAALDRKNSIQSVVDFNYNADLDFYNQNRGNFQDVLARAGQDDTSSTSGTQWSNTVEDSTRSMDFGPEGNAAAADVLQAARNAPWEVNNLLAQQQAAANRAISGAQRSQRSNIGNLAASRGVDSRLMTLGMDQPFNAQRLDADLQTKQQAYANRVGAYGNLAGVLKNLFQKDISHSEQSMKGGSQSSTRSSADPLRTAAALQYLRPPKKEVVV